VGERLPGRRRHVARLRRPEAGHPRAFGNFQRTLGRYVREDSVPALEAAVLTMTSLAAQREGLDERGGLERDMCADVVVFGPAAVIDRVTYEPSQRVADRVRFVAVNGVLVLDGGRVIGARPGRALRVRGAAAGGDRQPPTARAASQVVANCDEVASAGAERRRFRYCATRSVRESCTATHTPSSEEHTHGDSIEVVP
jgi:hypothetical protein